MALKDKVVEPQEQPSAEAEAIALFVECGWGDDANWLGPVSLAFIRRMDDDQARSVDRIRELRLRTVAEAKTGARVRGSRDRALLAAFARLCGCGGKGAALGWRVPAADDPPQQCPGLDEWRALAAEFRTNRASGKGADFESALTTGGWPGEYETEAEIAPWFHEIAEDMANYGGVRDFYGLPAVVRLMHILVDAAGLDLTRVIDDGAVVALGVRRSEPAPGDSAPPRVPLEVKYQREPIENARSLTNWMFGLGPRALLLFFPRVAEWRNDTYAGAMAMGVRHVIETWLLAAALHPTGYLQGGEQLAKACRPYFDLLHVHCAGKPEQALRSVRRNWIWFALCTFAAHPKQWESLAADAQESLLRAATEDLAALRKLLARARPRPLNGEERESAARSASLHGETIEPLGTDQGSEGCGTLLPTQAAGFESERQRASWEEFEWEKDHLQSALMLLYQFGGIWRGLKPMLLAWRALSTPAVARDLRYWQERDREDPPKPWSDLVAWPINLFHASTGAEESHGDLGLVKLRGEIAMFCIERLVDRWSKAEREEAKRQGRGRTNNDMLERSPEWRYCMIRAVSALGINPERKGHRTLNVSAELDPDADVREAARQCYEQLRRNTGLPKGVSPRRAILSALWWIRQGHLLGLGIQPDPDGAQRTRVKELARTKEIERDA